MFNLLKKSKTLVKSVMPQVVNEREVIMAIHSAFDNAGEELLKEAKEILSKDVDTDKGERLTKLGFVASSSAIDARSVVNTRREKQAIAERIEYFAQWYPNNKFITESEVERICKKYGLVFGEAKYYKGDVPEKNVIEIENFKLREEDMQRIDFGWYKREYSQHSYYSYFLESSKDDETASYGAVRIERRGADRWFEVKPETETHEFVKDSFRICAPESDFDMTHLKREGHKLELHVPDPIVLQPVSGGYLIISKWGLEASDEDLVNEKMN